MGLGTHNAVVALGGGAYFEIICRDPSQPEPPKLWMGMEELEAEVARIHAYFPDPWRMIVRGGG